MQQAIFLRRLYEKTKLFLRTLLLVALVMHVVFLLSRIPGQVYQRRFRKLAEWQAAGGNFGWKTRGKRKVTQETLAWLKENTPPGVVIPYDPAALQRPIEFTLVYAALAPRLLVKAQAIDNPDAGYKGRPLAWAISPSGKEGWLYLVSRDNRLVVEAR